MDIFLYGTLLNAELRAVLLGTAGRVPASEAAVPEGRVPAGAAVPDGPAPASEAAVLEGHAVERAADRPLPMLVPAAGGQARGLLLRGLDAPARARLDTYEVAFGYLPRPVTVATGCGPAQAAAYFPPEGQEGAGRPWALSEWEADELGPALLAAEELLAHDPPLDAPQIARQWMMIERRAHARHRARTAPRPPAALRHDPGPGDWQARLAAPLQGTFFKLSAFEAEHRTFAGGRSGPLAREVFLGIDAALVLPYDAMRDRLLLVEQFRMGPMQRHDRNPWTLEPIAGMIDARETPEECALRESVEEAGLVPDRLERMFACYASPGSATDYFHCYLGHCALEDDSAYSGGLASESEDLRLHVVDYDRAMGLLDSGEIDAGPLVGMLLWLARHRDRLRAAA